MIVGVVTLSKNLNLMTMISKHQALEVGVQSELWTPFLTLHPKMYVSLL